MPGVNVPAIKVNTVGYARSWRKIAIFNVEPKGAVVQDARTGAVVLRAGAGRGDRPRDRRGLARSGLAGGLLRAAGGRPLPAGGRGRAERSLRDRRGRLPPGHRGRRQELLLPALPDGPGPCRTRAGRSRPSPGRAPATPTARWAGTWPTTRPRSGASGCRAAGTTPATTTCTCPRRRWRRLTLLFAYEWAPGLFRDLDLQIPESSNRTPDLLDEVRYGLSWILSLQEPSGAFRHSETVMEWSPPGAAPTRIARCAGWPSRAASATAKAVAVLAVAARLFATWDRPLRRALCGGRAPGLAFLAGPPRATCGPCARAGAARRCGTTNPTTMTRARASWPRSRCGAASGCRRRSRPAQALLAERRGDARARRRSWTGAWANISRFGLWTLARDRRDAAPRSRAEAGAAAGGGRRPLRSRVETTDGYRCASAPDDYFWASNSNLMEKLLVMAMAARLDPERGWLTEAAQDQWHWILGPQPQRLLDGHAGRERA